MAELIIEVKDGIGRLSLHRPEQRNALTGELLIALRGAFRDLAADKQVRVITLTGSGADVFCAGADLKSKGGGRGDYRQLLLEIHACPKPTVALARGHVLAGGLGLFLACDLGLACEDIQFSTPEINVGMFPMMVLALLLRAVGRKKALELAFLGEKISSQDALSSGMLNRIFPRARFDELSDDFVTKISAKSGAILRIGKEAVQKAEELRLAESLESLEKSLEQVMASNDSKEGIRAFAEKRKPQWKDS